MKQCDFIVYYCVLLFIVVHYCLLLFIIVYYCLLLFIIVYYCLLGFIRTRKYFVCREFNAHLMGHLRIVI